jgi:hypothetical protein
MIQINCNNCKALLQIDDAFAGGVCRCRYCGTIQTVPKHLKQSANGEQAAVSTSAVKAGAAKARTLYKKKPGSRGEGAVGSGSGLDELANIVASSGLASARLTKGGQPGQPQSPEQGQAPTAKLAGMDRRTVWIVSAAGGLIVLLLGVIIVMAVSDKTKGPPGGGNAGLANNSNTSSGGNATGNTAAVNPGRNTGSSVPTFLGQTLDHTSVSFVLDRSAGTINNGRLELLKTALHRTLEQFGEGRRFQVVFWDRDNTAWSFPKNGLAVANKANLDALWAEMQNVTGGGQTKADKAFKKAADVNPDAIVLVPVKPFMEDDFDAKMLRARGTSRAKVYCFSLAQPELEAELRQLSDRTGGEYRLVSQTDLRDAGR